MSFDEEQLNDLYAAFPDLQRIGSIPSDQIRNALEKLGCPVAGHELRDMQAARGKIGSLCDLDELYQIYLVAKAMKIDSKKILKDAILRGIQEAKVKNNLNFYKLVKIQQINYNKTYLNILCNIIFNGIFKDNFNFITTNKKNTSLFQDIHFNFQ